MTPTTAITPHNPLEGDKQEMSITLHDGAEELVSIIIVHKDRPEYLNILLQSIAVTSYNNNYEVIVVDNASGPESQEFLKDIEKDVKVVKNDKNLYWSDACNRGVSASNSSSKYFIFMHCDTVILNPAWIDILLNVVESKKSGLVGVETNAYHVGGHKVDYVQEWLMLMSRDCYTAIGGWPEKLPLIGNSFVVSIAAQNKGFGPQVVKMQIAHHYKIFAIDINELERMQEAALAVLPSLLQKAQSQAVESKIN